MSRVERKVGIVHECELELEEDDFSLSHKVNSGSCIPLKRFLWFTILIWRYNSRSRATYKSEHTMRRENVRKLRTKNLVFHPFSMLVTIWELWMCILFSIIYLLPLLRFIGIRLLGIRFALFAINVFDILMRFNSGYQRDDTKQIVCKRRLIAAHYLKTLFILDVASLPGYFWTEEDDSEKTILRYVQFLVLLRVPTFIMYAHHTRASHNAYVDKSNFITLILPIIIMTIWICHMFYVIDREYIEDYQNLPDTWVYKSFHIVRVYANVYAMGYAYHYGLKPELLDAIAIIVGFIMQLMFLTFIYRVVKVRIHPTFKYIDVQQQMDCYASMKNLPKSIRKRMHEYMEYKFRNGKFQEPAIFHTLPDTSRKDLSTCLYSQLLEKSAIFHNMPMEVILKLTSHVTGQLYMPSEVVVEAGTQSDTIYFIRRGMVAIYTPSGKEVSHLKDGNYFGELVIIQEVRNATVIAIDWCEIGKLSRSNLMGVMEDYPELMKKLQQDVHRRSATVAQSDAWSLHSESEEAESDNSSSTTMLQI